MPWAMLAAVGVFLAVLLHEGVDARLGSLAPHAHRATDDSGRGGVLGAAVRGEGRDSGRRVGIGAQLAGLAAMLRAGRDVHAAFGRCFAAQAHADDPQSARAMTMTDCNGDIDVGLLAGALRASALPGETAAEIRHASHGLRAACRLGLRLGCPTARCVEAVRAAHVRIHMREELRRNAFAVPQSTVKMLLGLPAVTVVLGEVLGANPIGVLFGSWQGMCCLGLGVVCYALGAVWMHRLMRRTGVDDD
ncbi:hypothetical protein [Bifidobacterium sp. AGR2158]|uniref:type II secretion system F family protein n=1 Tax=Bifidobacterium sp. AGR2158 TaxID=1280675 RepID=UPI000686EA91|nr:hypothetical protein [Bifidobacterium sp. AGR2158]